MALNDKSAGPNQSIEDFSDSSGHEEWQLLEESESSDSEIDDQDIISKHDLATAPLMTREAHIFTGQNGRIAQYGVLGRILSIQYKGKNESIKDQRLYLNTNAPFSAIVCGVQGSGKSHTVSAILENMMISNFPAIGSLAKPLSGLVLHYGEGGANSLPNETAWLSSSISSFVNGPPVVVYVSRSSLQTMRAVYRPLGSKVTVEPLVFENSELDSAAILSMMAVGSVDSAPLYMQIILSILRDLGENFTFSSFLQTLEMQKQKFNPAQLSGLEQRLSLLSAFLTNPKSTTVTKKKATALPVKEKPSRFQPGQLTIIDLSDPFLDTASACSLFEIIVRLFVRADVGTGKVLVVDEAHKYLSSDRSATGLTKALLGLIRQQRHLAMRVIISTQEPTVVPPVLLDLCSVAILHRFSSPTWWQHLIQHVPTDFSQCDAFDKVVKLQTGHAIVLAPSGIGLFSLSASSTKKGNQLASTQSDGNGDGDGDGDGEEEEGRVLARFGRRYLIVKTRKRVTVDGGASILVVGKP